MSFLGRAAAISRGLAAFMTVWAACLCLAGLANADQALAGPVVGRVSLAVGASHRISVDGIKRPLKLGDVLYERDRVVTGMDAMVMIVFVDQGRLALRPDTDVYIKTYRVDSSGAETRLDLELLRGTVRQISGDAAKLQPERYRLNTPIAAIGVRGTDFLARSVGGVVETYVHEGTIVIQPPASECPLPGRCAIWAAVNASDAGALLQVAPGGAVRRSYAAAEDVERIFGVRMAVTTPPSTRVANGPGNGVSNTPPPAAPTSTSQAPAQTSAAVGASGGAPTTTSSVPSAPATEGLVPVTVAENTAHNGLASLTRAVAPGGLIPLVTATGTAASPADSGNVPSTGVGNPGSTGSTSPPTSTIGSTGATGATAGSDSSVPPGGGSTGSVNNGNSLGSGAATPSETGTSPTNPIGVGAEAGVPGSGVSTGGSSNPGSSGVDGGTSATGTTPPVVPPTPPATPADVAVPPVTVPSTTSPTVEPPTSPPNPFVAPLPKGLVWASPALLSSASVGFTGLLSAEQARVQREATVGELGAYTLWRDVSGTTAGSYTFYGNFLFTLAQGQAQFTTGSGSVVPVPVEQGTLNLQFDSSTFSTSLRLGAVGGNPAVAYSTSGKVDANGIFTSRDSSGALGGALSADGREAGYFFRSQTNAGTYQGITLWTTLSERKPTEAPPPPSSPIVTVPPASAVIDIPVSTPLPNPATDPSLSLMPLPTQLVWGAFSSASAISQLSTVPYAEASQGRRVTVGELGQFALWRAGSQGTLVNAFKGSFQFGLSSAQVMYTPAVGATVVATVNQASLQANFDTSTFTTRLTFSGVAVPAASLFASGSINDEGIFVSRASDGSQSVAGAFSFDAKEAGYLFKLAIQGGQLQGITLWGRKP